MVLAEHRTPVGRIVAVTVETVRFDPPERIDFRLVRGPVADVEERFVLRELDGGATELEYAGELASDGWALGALWGRLVATRWEQAVAASLRRLAQSAEEAAARRRRRGTRG